MLLNIFASHFVTLIKIMIRRTPPAVSFTPSHRALMMRSSKPLLGGHDMSGLERFKESWDEMPMHKFGWSRKEVWTWHWRCMYDLGLRDNNWNTKSRIYGFWIFFPMACYLVLFTVGIQLAYLYNGVPEYMNKDNGPRNVKAWFGKEVWCADGKFSTPYFHIAPPMFTMKQEDL